MWKPCLIAFCLGGLFVGAIVNRGIDRSMHAEQVQVRQIRIAHLAQTMVDTCFFERIDPEHLAARLGPAGFLASSENSRNTAQFSGVLVDRLTFVDAGGVAECSAVVQVGKPPTFIDTCRTAIEFNRSLSSMLKRDERRNPYANYELVHQAGLTNDARTNRETCHFRHHGRAFTWALRRGGIDFDVTLDSVISESPLLPSTPAYQFSIRRVTL